MAERVKSNFCGVSLPLRPFLALITQRFQLGDGLKISRPARGPLDFDQPIEPKTATRHAEQLELDR